KLEVAHLNLQLKYQHLKENIENFKSKSYKDVPEFDTFFELGIRDDQIQGHKNTIHTLKAQISQLKANKSDELRTLDYKSLDSQNFQLNETVTRVKHMEKITSLLNEIENLKTQNNGLAHQSYLNRLKDSLDTLCEIVEEDRIAKPHDNAVAHACTYTKRSQELLEYVIGTCPKAFNKRDKYIATTSSTRKKHVTFAEPLETSNHSTSKPVQHPEVKKSNVPISPSTEVNSDTKASRLKPRSNIKNDRTSTAKSVPKMFSNSPFLSVFKCRSYRSSCDI
ncbi:hypothetical protein Tco_0048019, partial [Tanacetum coccineum]